MNRVGLGQDKSLAFDCFFARGLNKRPLSQAISGFAWGEGKAVFSQEPAVSKLLVHLQSTSSYQQM
jgi:hypothetical protein